MNLIDLIGRLCMKNHIVLNMTINYIKYEKRFTNSVDCYDYIITQKIEKLKVRNIDIFSSAGYTAFVIDCIE